MLADCSAEDYKITVGYAPYCEHIISDKERYNERNNHALLVGYNNWWGLTFRNSSYRRVWAAGYRFKSNKKFMFHSPVYVRGNLLVGLVHGYKHRTVQIAGISPAIAPTLEFGYKNAAIHGAFLGAAVTLMFVGEF